jgi:organic radical activating enzyme
MKQPVAIVNNDYDDMMTIDIMLGNICNYSCHYCHPGSNEGTVSFPKNFELFKKNIGHLIDVYRDYGKKNIRIELTGGEPTLWPNLGNFATFLKKEKQIEHILLVTNGSRTLRWFSEYAEFFDEFHLSLHSEQGDARHICDIASFILNNTNSHVAINVLIDPLNYQQSLHNLNYAISHKDNFLVKTWMLVENGEIRKDYSPDQLELFRDKVHKIPSTEYIEDKLKRKIIPDKSNAKVVYDDGTIETYNSYDLRTNNLHNYSGWLCNLGVDRVCIINGEIRGSCGADYLFNQTVLNILDNDFINKFNKSLLQPIECKQLSCASCTKDLKIPKAKIHVPTKKYISITPRNYE